MITPIAAGTVPWPDELAQAYARARWWRGQALGAEIAAVAAARKTATALVDGATRISYASLAARADALAGRLTDGLGLERGDRIVVQLPNGWPFAVLTLGCLRAGIVPVMALPAHREHELAYLCEHSEARALIARTHNDYAYNARASAELCGLDECTVYLAALPASHNFPLACPGILGTLLSGGRVVMLASPQSDSVFAMIEQEGVTITAVVPAVRAAEQNARAFTPDGWYASGDVVRRRPDGNLVVEGRDKDMINRGGEKISAEEVENLLYRMPGIAQVAAVAAPDAELGERVCVFVVPSPGVQAPTLDAIRDGMAAAGVARFKWPERLEVVAELPVTKVGKLDKKALRDTLAFGRSVK